MTGYFGKVSTLGDFVARGLPDGLVAAWDAWLQQCIQASREQLGDQWLNHYLTSPVWRFAISPGVLGPEGLGGVMMPSVDRVGRYFPLMIAAVGAPPLLDWFHKHAAWYDAIEDLARASLDAAFRLEQFDGLPEAGVAVGTSAVPVGETWRFGLDEGVGERVAAAVLQGHSLWWTEGSPGIEPSMLVCAGMPRARGFSAMLDGI
ncbi:MAG: type VI secretion system-associated protein TagF [Massilia sp.]|nr:type VI secretion system-associated protein TagF [Massilia sp.]